MSPNWQNSENVFAEKNHHKGREPGSVDCVKKKHSSGPKHTADFTYDLLKIDNMFEHVDTNHIVDAPASHRQSFAGANEITYGKVLMCRVALRNGDGFFGGIDADYGCAPEC